MFHNLIFLVREAKGMLVENVCVTANVQPLLQI